MICYVVAPEKELNRYFLDKPIVIKYDREDRNLESEEWDSGGSVVDAERSMSHTPLTTVASSDAG